MTRFNFGSDFHKIQFKTESDLTIYYIVFKGTTSLSYKKIEILAGTENVIYDKDCNDWQVLIIENPTNESIKISYNYLN